MKQARALLAAIPGFGDACISERLPGGVASRSYRVERGGKHFVLRVDSPEAARLGLDRRSEQEVCAAIAKAGFGPSPLFFDADRGVYLRRFLPGRAWTPADLLHAENLERLAGLLRRLHAVRPAGRAFDPLAHAVRYANQIATPKAQAMLAVVKKAHALIEPSVPVLCHNDLLAQNVLESDTLMLIDWEFAGMGDAYFDLAVVTGHHELPELLVDEFLQAYLARPVVNADRQRLQRQQDFYRSLLELWTARLSLL
ncbi:MAG: phosphotransferase family protein [Gammaproteobacteria bacterium]|nr:phosphotransferase family protein [Gammaproteobacteria bacterium]